MKKETPTSDYDFDYSTFSWIFFSFSLLFFIIYSSLTLRLLKLTKAYIDSFSKKTMLVYLVGFLIKAILWLAVAIDVEIN